MHRPPVRATRRRGARTEAAAPSPTRSAASGGCFSAYGRLPRTELDHGIYAEHTNGVVISQNWIYDNADFGVHLYPGSQGTRVTGNVIDGNGMGVTFSGEERLASSGNLVDHNVISNSV